MNLHILVIFKTLILNNNSTFTLELLKYSLLYKSNRKFNVSHIRKLLYLQSFSCTIGQLLRRKIYVRIEKYIFNVPFYSYNFLAFQYKDN